MPQRSTKRTDKCFRHFARFVLLCVVLSLFSASEARAASLFGRVIDVSSGDLITVFNLNRPVRVKLLGVDAPDMGQAFGDVAKQHLADLVHDKSVVVEYSGIAADGSIAGRVLLNETDIGAQMIRDGVAWFDSNNLSRLSAADREIYQQSEMAARNERRGLWQADNPVAPWEFVKAEARKKDPVARLNSILASRKRGDEPVPELTNLTLMMGMDAPTRRPLTHSEITAAWDSLTPTYKDWHEIRPAGHNLSTLVPEEGRQLTLPVLFGHEMVDVNMHIARDGASLYAIFWFTGPTYGETDQLAIAAMVPGLIKTAHEKYEVADRGYFLCGKQREKDVSMNGYTGREFDLSSCLLPTRARAFTKVIGDQRQMYVGLVFYGDEEENVSRFVKSFTVAGQKDKPRKR